MDCSLPGASVHGIFQARVLEWVAIAFSSHTLVMFKILQARLQQYMNRELPDVQAGFRKGRETRDHIAKHSLGHRKSKRVPEKHLLLLSRFSRVQLCATP